MTMQTAGTAIEIDLTLQKEDSTPQDVSTATLTWRLTRAYSVPSVLAKDNDATGGVSFDSDGIDGLVVVSLVPDDTLDLQGTYYHEIKAHWSDSQEKTWQLGTIFFSESAVAAD
jgi:hypothetical protein